jgi:hypothetical protein
MPSSNLDVVFWVKKTNRFGLSQDAEVFRHLFTKANNGKRILHFHVKDPLEPPIPADINIHLEIPVYVAVPWASVNLLLVNPEWYSPEWDSYLSRFDMLLVRDAESAKRFRTRFPNAVVEYVPWCLPPTTLNQISSKENCSKDSSSGFAWFVAGSKNKREAVEWLLPFWKESYPPLQIVAVEPFNSLPSKSNVSYTIGDLDSKQRKEIALSHAGQICISKSESFGYGTAEAEAYGSYLLLNTLDVYQNDYPYVSSMQMLPTKLVEKDYARVADLSGTEFLQDILDTAVVAFKNADLSKYQTQSKEEARLRQKQTEEVFYEQVYKFVVEWASDRKESKPKHLPPVLMQDDCPPISVVTLLYNRRKFFDLACHNIMLSDYPKDKIEWIIVEDSDDPNEDASDRVIQVGMKAAPLQLVYVPLGKKTPIGEKRNKGIERAKNDIILFMDDDDHYPETSFRRRVAWLTKHPMNPQCVGCTTIACYDLLRGVSAVNTPPLALSLGKRISEATLCFTRQWWEAKKFAKDNLSEGATFLEGRESHVLELPPQQIIVAFSHQKNTSGRRIPTDDAKPGCFWGFPKEYLLYIHNLVGVKVEEE